MQIRLRRAARWAPRTPEPTTGRHRHWRVVCGLAAVPAAASLALTACGSVAVQAGAQACTAVVETLPASVSSSVIALVPRTSAADAEWGLEELAQLMPFIARGGLQLHVLYTQDSDDLVEGGGDGGPPQVIFTEAPSFPSLDVTGEPQRPSDPTALTSKLYCGGLAAWQHRAAEIVQEQGSARAAETEAWARRTASRLAALAGRPIPDTRGAEAGTEIDSGASIFSATQIAETAPQPIILFLGGLTALAPPPENFRLSARLVALVRSSDPVQVLQAEASWRRWAEKAGGSFEAVSANAASGSIAQDLEAGRE
jgi:hypothetical protein